MNSKSSVQHIKEKAILCLNEGRLTEAQSALADACERDPDDSEIWYLRAVIFQMSGAHEDADRSIRTALKLDQHNPEAYYVLGPTLLEQNRTEEAVDVYRHALDLNPDHGEFRRDVRILKQTGESSR